MGAEDINNNIDLNNWYRNTSLTEHRFFLITASSISLVV